MIEFVTAFLGLTWGQIPVELRAEPQVAHMEVWVDGSKVGAFNQPPWAFSLNLGPRLVPHLLEVRSFSSSGEQIGEATQLLNHARSNYEASIWIEPEDRSRGAVHWSTVLDLEPYEIDLKFNGQDLDVDSTGRFSLPPHDLSQPQVLEARLAFAQRQTRNRQASHNQSIRMLKQEARADLSFGGFHGDRVTSALTAVPLELPEGFSLPEASELETWFESSAESPQVFESNPSEAARVVIVRDLALLADWRSIAASIPQRLLPDVVDDQDQVVHVSTRAAIDGSGVFPLVHLKQRGLKKGLFKALDSPPGFDGTQRPRRIWDALAVAGKTALEGSRVRAIVLLLGDDQPPTAKSAAKGTLERDASALSPYQVRDFLSAIQVPLLCWEPEPDQRCVGERAFHGAGGIAELLLALDQGLARQHIVWLEGIHLPQSISLTEKAPQTVTLVR